jgi:pimeloyl-ACP methyl ester carboxylesterase
MKQAFIAAFFLVVFGWSGADAQTPAGAGEGRISSERCRVSAPDTRMRCGRLDVPLNRADPSDRRRMRISFAVLEARSQNPQPDPVVFLTGGPGASAFYFLNVLAASPTLADRDLIVIEQRGNGYSSPNLLCSVDAGETIESATAAVRDCRAQLERRDVAFDAYNITESAHDLADLRAALEIESWNVLGTSFGSFWALRYADLHPEGVRSLVLDSPYPLQAEPGDGWIAHLNGLGAVFAACAADAACADAYPDLSARFSAFVAAANETPVRAGRSTFNGRDVFNLVNGANFETATVAMVPRLADALVRGDFETAGEIVSLDPYGAPRGFRMSRAFSIGSNINIPCVDDQAFVSPDGARLQLAQEWSPAMLDAGRASAFDKGQVCRDFWRVAPADPILNMPVRSDIPALIVAGALDPETPPELGAVMAETLPNATLLVLPDSAHAALSAPSACTTRILSAFLHAPHERPDTSCVSSDHVRFSLPNDPIVLTRAGR